MQKSLAELTALDHEEIIQLVNRIGAPLLVTQDEEPRLVLQPVEDFELMVRRLRFLEAETGRCRSSSLCMEMQVARGAARIIPFRRG